MGVGGCHTQWSEGARCGYSFTYPCSGEGVIFFGEGDNVWCGGGGEWRASGCRWRVGGCHTRLSEWARCGYTFTYPCSGEGVLLGEG